MRANRTPWRSGELVGRTSNSGHTPAEKRRHFVKVLPFLALVCLLAVTAACGGDKEAAPPAEPAPAEPVPAEPPAEPAPAPAEPPAEPPAEEPPAEEPPAEPIKMAWLLYGPIEDGGFNVMHRATWEKLEAQFGDAFEAVYTDNVPFAEEAGQITQRFIDEGANVVIDSVGLAEIFNDVCAANPDVVCYGMGQLGELPPNEKGFWVKHWVPAYVAGVAAGLLTESNTVGFVSPFDAPLINAVINSYALGCRSVNPDCETRLVTTNDYYNPPVTTQATNTLLDAGADVLRGFTDDPTYCRPAEERGAWAVPEFWDGSELCPNAAATSTMWDYSAFLAREIEKIQSGAWNNEVELLPPAETFTLAPWAEGVPTEVQAQVEQVLADIGSGALNPWVGPIADSNGEIRVQEGEELTEDFIFGEWDWYVEGVVAG